MNAQRGAPPFAAPRPHNFTTRVPSTPDDPDVARRRMFCHRSQLSDEVIERVFPAAAAAWNGAIPLVPPCAAAARTDLFD